MRLGIADEYGTIWSGEPGASPRVGDLIPRRDEETFVVSLDLRLVLRALWRDFCDGFERAISFIETEVGLAPDSFPTEIAICRDYGGGGNRTRVTCPTENALSSENAPAPSDDADPRPLVTRGGAA